MSRDIEALCPLSESAAVTLKQLQTPPGRPIDTGARGVFGSPTTSSGNAASGVIDYASSSEPRAEPSLSFAAALRGRLKVLATWPST